MSANSMYPSLPADIRFHWRLSLHALASSVEIEYDLRPLKPFHPSQASPASVHLESLDLRMLPPAGLSAWLMDPLCPFNFSALKALSIYYHTDLLRSPNFTPAHQTIQTLELVANYLNPILDLSAFPRLEIVEIVRITVPSQSWEWLLDTLSSTTPSSRISKIVLVCSMNDNGAAMLDAKLSGLAVPPMLELETWGYPYPSFPLLSSKNLFRRVDYDREWFRWHKIKAASPHATAFRNIFSPLITVHVENPKYIDRPQATHIGRGDALFGPTYSYGLYQKTSEGEDEVVIGGTAVERNLRTRANLDISEFRDQDKEIDGSLIFEGS
ncbi:hypothetical protein C8R44DRAFT_856333 [Mycena epipterygia]|nr:hypothetical protein C8R44DRAFT_856333 [Mycena epipterygia]